MSDEARPPEGHGGRGLHDASLQGHHDDAIGIGLPDPLDETHRVDDLVLGGELEMPQVAVDGRHGSDLARLQDGIDAAPVDRLLHRHAGGEPGPEGVTEIDGSVLVEDDELARRVGENVPAQPRLQGLPVIDGDDPAETQHDAALADIHPLKTRHDKKRQESKYHELQHPEAQTQGIGQ